MDISVVIPSYNTAATLGSTLEALEAQRDAPSYEIIVVDCSDDDSVERLAQEHRGVRVLRRTQRFNPGEGRNIGARQAQGQLLVFVDSDVTLRPDALRAASQFYARGNLMFGGALELDESGATAASYLEHYFFNHESQVGRPECPRANLSSALMAVDRDLFLSHGGFRDIPRMQDTELSERVREQGVSLRFTPTVVGYQVQDSPLSQVLKKVKLNGRNLYFIRYASKGAAYRWAFLVLLPVASFMKTSRIILRHLRYQDMRKRLITLRIAPLLGLAGMHWMLGFYDGILFQRGISRER